MAAGRYSFIIEQGATLDLSLNWTDSESTPIDLTGYSGRMHIRPTVESSTIYLALSSSLQSDGTGINFNGSNGTTPLASGSIGIYISAATSSLLEFHEAYYDLELEKEGYVVRLIEGQIRLSKNVTR
jgi:hypothetical protein